jgi:hypothetical protein
MPIAQNSIIGDRPHRLARRSILTVEWHFFCKCRTCCQNWIIRNFFLPGPKMEPSPRLLLEGEKLETLRLFRIHSETILKSISVHLCLSAFHLRSIYRSKIDAMQVLWSKSKIENRLTARSDRTFLEHPINFLPYIRWRHRGFLLTRSVVSALLCAA